jgi:Mg-chelatase subunit ChlD
MAKKLLMLGSDGNAILRRSDGTVEQLPEGHPLGAPLPHFAILAIDCSSSMEGSGIEEAKKGALSFAEDAIQRGYTVGLLSFSSDANLVCRPGISVTELRRGINSLSTDGSTNMTDAIKLASEHLPGGLGPRAVVIVTDGNPDNRDSAMEAAAIIKKRGVDVIAIGAGSADAEFLARLASRANLSVMVAKDSLALGISKAAKLLPAPRRQR